MKEKNIVFEMLKGLALIILSIFGWTIMFSFVNTDSDFEDASGLILILALLTSFAVILIRDYNRVRQLEQAAKASSSHIQVVEKRNADLLDKANRFVDKHQKLEKETILDINKSVSKVHKLEEKAAVVSSKIETSQEFGQLLKEIPELTINKNVERLLDEIFETENTLAQWKISYNQQVEAYNIAIRLFPMVLVSKVAKLQEMSFYQESTTSVTDKMLGL